MVHQSNNVYHFGGGRVKSQRERLGIGEEVASRALGMTVQQFGDYEREHARFGADDLRNLTKLLRVSVAVFFEGFPPRGARSAAWAEAAE
jgi:transcriptional regulator with XRE-family HTH domain